MKLHRTNKTALGHLSQLGMIHDLCPEDLSVGQLQEAYSVMAQLMAEHRELHSNFASKEIINKSVKVLPGSIRHFVG